MENIVAFPGIRVRPFSRPHRGGGKSAYLADLRNDILRIGGAVIVVTSEGRVESHRIIKGELVVEDFSNTVIAGNQVVSTPKRPRGHFTWTDDWSV